VHIQQVALTCGLDPLALLRRGIPRRHLDNSKRFRSEPSSSFSKLVLTSSGVEDFCLRVAAEARGVWDFGPVIPMLREAATARDALRTLASLLYLHSNGISMRLEDASTPYFRSNSWRQT
jgi:hypothetical protein